MTEEQLKTLRKAKAIEQSNKQKLLKHFGNIPNTSGIYILTREENGFKFAYIGQAKNILTRLAEHLKVSCGIYDKKNIQHIDNSLKKHGLKSEDNPTGYSCLCMTYELGKLDEWEQFWIKEYANMGYQLRNKTSGGQDSGKKDIAENITKGYLQGLHNGYEKARKEIAKLFKKNLTFDINGKPTVNKQKALQKFKDFLEI